METSLARGGQRPVGRAVGVAAWLVVAGPASAGAPIPLPIACSEPGAVVVVGYQDSDPDDFLTENFGECRSDTLWGSRAGADTQGATTGGGAGEVRSDGYTVEAEAAFSIVLGSEEAYANGYAWVDAWGRFTVPPDRPLLDVRLEVESSGGRVSAVLLSDGIGFAGTLPPDGISHFWVEVPPGEYELLLNVGADVDGTGEAAARVSAAVAAPEPRGTWLSGAGALVLVPWAAWRGRRETPRA